jgi:hypothetical protein
MGATVHRLQTKHKNKPTLAITYKGFFSLPDVVLNHPGFIALSGKAIKLLVDVGAQYNGRNNGNLCCTRSIMRSRGWTSNKGLDLARDELIDLEWLVQTKQGGRGIGPSLFAITWQPIDECGGRHDLKPTKKPYRDFYMAERAKKFASLNNGPG